MFAEEATFMCSPLFPCIDTGSLVLHAANPLHEGQHNTAKMVCNRRTFHLLTHLSVSVQEPGIASEATPEAAGQASAAAGPFGMASMVEEFLADSFLQQLFAKFFGMLYEEAPKLNSQVQSVSKQLQQLLEQRLGWDFDVHSVGQDDEDDEYAPVVVQLDSVTL